MGETRLIGIDLENKWISAIVVEKTGVDGYAVGAIGKKNDNSGFNLIIMKPDQEPAIRAPLQAVKKGK